MLEAAGTDEASVIKQSHMEVILWKFWQEKEKLVIDLLMF